MKKSHLILIILLLMVVGYAATQIKLNIKGNTTLSENTSDFNVYLANLKLNGTEIEGINETKDGYEINVPSKGTLEYDVVNDSTEYDVEATVECEEENKTNKVTNFDYTGGEQTFTAPINGTYKLETWGAQGGNFSSYIPGYGGYSSGTINLNKSELLYINVGGKGSLSAGGYNGGGNSSYNAGGGGGATHIALKSGLLSALENYKNEILTVSGGGGGSSSFNSYAGGSAGGYVGSNGTGRSPGQGGTQTSGGESSSYTGPTATAGGKGLFGVGGIGGSESEFSASSGAGGAGYYGGSGGGARDGGGGGGSSYIGNSLLSEKSMYCYNCTESTEEATKTISTTCVNETPTENCAKKGNGYARITLITQLNENNQLTTSTQLDATIIEAQDELNNKVEIENNNIKCNLKIKKLSRTEKRVYNGPTEWTFDYTGEEEVFNVPTRGTYKIETWGAQGGGNGGNTEATGGYSVGSINLKFNQNLYINVGASGKSGTTGKIAGGYNGGGEAYAQGNYGSFVGSGGGATHISLSSGLLSTFENNRDDLLIVSGGGGGSNQWKYSSTSYSYYSGGNAGGFEGTSAILLSLGSQWQTSLGTGGTQISGGQGYEKGVFSKGVISKKYSGSFGKGASTDGSCGDNGATGGGAGGGGYYGGGAGAVKGGAGGSSYIGNSLLTEKSMYCYNCAESTEESTKTISTTCTSATPTEKCAKSGNGYARITLIK